MRALDLALEPTRPMLPMLPIQVPQLERPRPFAGTLPDELFVSPRSKRAWKEREEREDMDDEVHDA